MIRYPCVHAVLDAARNDGIYDRMLALAPDARGLFS